MKKCCGWAVLLACFPLRVAAGPVFADDFAFQKQLVINQNQTCQAFRIHEHWFATAAHCVQMCTPGSACDVRILLAYGPVSASVAVSAREVFIPKQYRTVNAQQRVTTHKNWDVALIHYQPEQYQYTFAEGGTATAEEFNQALIHSRSLRVQWQGAVKPQIPVLYAYGGAGVMMLKQNIFVPRWDWGQMQSFSNPQTVLYFGDKQALWGADGFGVDHGNSGGAVVLENGGIVGIATAKMNNNLPADVRREFPKFGQAHGFFVFNGFAPQTTLKFIEKTMLRFGDRPTVKKLQRVKVPTETAL